ncbi:hypothetical protein A3A05_00565 [Candidatus Nomurabacteria bacterium RIFCSPLOWO2_01_FULL_41_12]|uniref:EfeO-type cupredoxin-like domain-containing protein n=1 Tax=Candidatus Nomurabacteria bacterium RIFCSPLOWO2_01_FULL_41_12 TaxID=1801774 RepID=A0A1F6WWW5_9BACT|nr:MAG: hypothetical protein A2732_00360 [Candidatus Nomurabacteria bacterium RIFCSPHIGHO2_01_FULL_40_10]OGI86245.1 MAG: hypothetical protein A3A05_00565 [Candidatus Nomurabacteria bacterium RIFCSPLOWO2_01_FULL_41_12]
METQYLRKIWETNTHSFLVLLVVSGCIFYYGYFTNPMVKNGMITVIINDKGFSPEKIIVPQGTTVKWVNQDERPHWPASNFHPTHSLYPEQGGCIGSLFDACRSLKEGEYYSFKFDIAGIWPVHDHLSPGMIMVIEVVDPVKSARDGVASLKDRSAATSNGVTAAEFRQLDYGKQMEIIKSMATSNPNKAWGYLKNSYIVDGQVVGNAHEFAHIVGNLAFEKFSLDGIKVCDATFAFGCFHGVTEKMLLSEGLGVIKSIENGCLEIFPPDKSQDYTSCIHGTGHGVYSFEGGDMKEALIDCDIISEPYRQYCYDGVFMERSSQPDAKIFDNKNPWKFCTDLPERYHRNCARYQSQIFLGAFGSLGSVKAVGKNCALGSSVLLRETCYESLGYYIAQQSLGKMSEILESCKQMPNTDGQSEGGEICMMGGAIESVFQKYLDFRDTSYRLCNSLTELRRVLCFNNIERMLK